MKKNKLSNMKLSSVDLVNRGANQDANIVFYKSDTSPDESYRQSLKKAFDYLKGLFKDDEPETVEKSDIVKEYDSYATQLLKSFDSIIDDTELDTESKTEKMQKSIQEFSAFMTSAVPVWANCQSVAKSDKLSEMIAKAENPDNEVVEEHTRKESEDMPLSKMSPEQKQELYKQLKAEFEGVEEPKEPKEPVVEPTTKSDNVAKSDVPEFVLNAIKKNEEFMESLQVKEMQEVAKKYEVLGEKADELGQQLHDLKKSDNKLYETSIAMLDRQVEAINKSGLFTEIGKSGANHTAGGGDVVSKVESIAKSYMDKDDNLSYQEAMVKAWEAHPELAEEYERGE